MKYSFHLKPAAIQSKILAKIAPVKVAEAGILQMLGVRKNREWRFRSLPNFSDLPKDRLPDLDIREHKLIRRLLANTIEDYILDPDIELRRGHFVSNPYGMTDRSEESLKSFFDTWNFARKLERCLDDKTIKMSAAAQKIIEDFIAEKRDEIKSDNEKLGPYIEIVEKAIDSMLNPEKYSDGKSKTKGDKLITLLEPHFTTSEAMTFAADQKTHEKDWEALSRALGNIPKKDGLMAHLKIAYARQYKGYTITDYGLAMLPAEVIKDTANYTHRIKAESERPLTGSPSLA